MTGSTKQEGSKPFLEHLEDLRFTIIRCVISLVGGIVLAIPLTPVFLDLLKRPLEAHVEDVDSFLQSIEVAGAFTATIRIAFWAGLLISTPVLIYYIARFVFPGLKERERQLVRRSSGFAVLLFVSGVALGYFITLPVAIGVMMKLHRWLGIEPIWTLSSYVAFTTQLLIAFGVVFEMPVIVLILGKLGILNSTQLREKRRFMIVALLIVAMLLTPPDVFTQLIMAVPLVILYEICIWLLKGTEGRETTREE